MQQLAIATTLLLCTMLAVAASAAEPTDKFLGKTIDQWAGEIESQSPAARHLAAWSLAQIGPNAEASLNAALRHDDPTVRYWGVVGLGTIAATEPLDSSRLQTLIVKLVALLGDKSAVVRIAAAETNFRINRSPVALRLLTDALSDPQEAVRIQAIDSLERLAPLPPFVHGDIEKATADSSQYVQRISSRLLKTLAQER